MVDYNGNFADFSDVIQVCKDRNIKRPAFAGERSDAGEQPDYIFQRYRLRLMHLAELMFVQHLV